MDILLQVVQKPAIIIAIVTLIGLIAMKNKPSKIIVGTVLAFVGFTMIKMGSSIVSGVLSSFSTLFTGAFNLEGLVPSNEAMMAATMDAVGGTASLTLVVGLVVNLVLARFTMFKSVYLSLHLALFTAFAYAAVGELLGLDSMVVIIGGGLLLGLYMAVSPTILKHFAKDVTGTDEYTVAHSGSLSYIGGSLLAKALGDKSQDAENLEVSDSILFLKNPNVATFLTMFILFFVSCLLCPADVFNEVSDGEVALLFSMEKAATFAGGLFVIKQGINMFIEQIVPAFKGFASIICPGAVPGVDILVLFEKYPNTSIIGFLCSFVVGCIMMVLLPLVGLPVIIPGLMACFITGGAAGILGNSQGGVRGAFIASAFDGLLLALMPALASQLFSALGVAGTTFADPDMIFTAAIFFGIGSIFH